MEYGGRFGLDGARLAYNSRMAAKVDSAAVQDGFGIYHHSFFVAREGEWAIVQQGMRDHDGTARRYHWLGSEVKDFVNEPHAAVASERWRWSRTSSTAHRPACVTRRGSASRTAEKTAILIP